MQGTGNGAIARPGGFRTAWHDACPKALTEGPSRAMEFAASPYFRLRALRPLPAMFVVVDIPPASHAADANRAVNARPGDVVPLRTVSRQAVQPAPPETVLLALPSRRPGFLSPLGSSNLPDDGIAQLGATPPRAAQFSSTVVHALDGLLVRGSCGNTVAGNGVSNIVMAPIGAIGNVIRGFGDQVRGALPQLSCGNGR